ncbi:50S ribosomal protein L31e [Thermoplasma sp.]|uniref:50S ribosomal protein L31e n=1 Tax=Thermoplasma sp. TaxID=1973142 RepID=UPI00263711B3|nr:50S ribosomal protein L31e [Thermoplasma sp.]
MADETVTQEVIINVPLRDAKASSRKRRADTAVSVLRNFISKKMKIDESKIWIDPKVSEKIWERGREHIPSKLSVKVIKLEEGTTEIIMP